MDDSSEPYLHLGIGYSYTSSSANTVTGNKDSNDSGTNIGTTRDIHVLLENFRMLGLLVLFDIYKLMSICGT